MPINCVHYMLSDSLFKHITIFSVLLLGEIDVLRMFKIRRVRKFSLLGEFDVLRMFKIPSCEKNATSIGLICFIYLNNI